MSNFIYNSQRVNEIIYQGSSEGLDDLVELEDILAFIKESEKKQDFLDLQKKSRIKLIEDEKEKLEQKIKFLELVAFNTLKKHKEKSVSFPKVGKIGIKKASDKNKYIIKDEVKLIKTFKESLSKEDLNKFIKVEEKIIKSNLNEALDEWNVNGKFPVGIKDLIETEMNEESLSIRLDKEVELEASNDDYEAPVKKVKEEIKKVESFFQEIDENDI